MMMTLLALAAALVQSAEAAPPPAAPAKPEKKVCRSMVMSGSIMPKRACMSREEWAKLHASTSGAWEQARDKRAWMSMSAAGGRLN